MGKIKCDFNVHLDNFVNYEAVKNVLIMAEKHEVKAISLMEHDALNLYKANGVLYNLIKTGEINNYYTGKIVSGIELNCIINDVPISKRKLNYNNYNMHIKLLDFDCEKIETFKWFETKFLEKCFLKDVKAIIKILKKLKLEAPKKRYFKYGTKVGTQVFNFMNENLDRKQKYQLKLGVFENSVDFNNLFLDPTSKLFFKSAAIPYLTDVLEFAKSIDARIYISHPCYMNAKFNTTDYLDTLLSLKTDLAFPYDGLEVNYHLNSVNDTKLLHDYATSHNLDECGGTGFKYAITPQNPTGQTYVVSNGQKSYFVPIVGNMIKTFYETGNGDALMEESFVNRLSDIREQKRFGGTEEN